MNTPTCPDCGRPLPAGVAGGGCPACLLGMGESETLLGSGVAAGDLAAELGAPDAGAAGDRIGRYHLLEVIGEGGFGVVWMAEQAEPVRRRVALKIIKLGMDTRQVVARFEAERQALALMDHQNIARVFDGGATESGRPYFVMELVRGVPLNAYCNTARLNLRERIELFIQVCQAVQHAHQKGIMHRDLKPSNVLVTEQDGKPVPKVIDFGIAKATEAELTEKTLFTRFNQLIGTPAYMSPEQAGLGSLDLDTRTDIYSLGVLLYELLTGRTPLDPQKLRHAGYEATLRSIREVEAPKPSTCLSALELEDLVSLAGQRREEPGRLRRLVHGDLDWIVLKALEKDRTRRYASANDLAADLQRFLNTEPIVARPPSNLYRFQKLARRNKLLVGAASAVLAALIAGVATTTWWAVRATRNFQQSQLSDYTTDINLAHQALAENNVSRALVLLDRHVPRPGEKEPQDDLRGFEWRYLRQLSRGTELASLPGGRDAVQFSPDGRYLALSGSNTNTTIRDVGSQQVVTNLPTGAISLAFSPRDPVLVTADFEQVRFWSTKNWQELRPPLLGVGFPVRFSPDGAWLLTGDPGAPGDPKAKVNAKHQLWRTDTWQPVESCRATPNYPWQVRNAVAFSQDGSLLATPWLSVSDEICGLRLWKVPSLEEAGFIHSEEITAFSAAFLPDGRLLMGTFYGDLVVRDLQNKAGDQTIKVLTGSLTTISVAPEAGIFVTTGNDQSVSLWDSHSLKILNRFRGQRSVIWASSVTPNGRRVATGGMDNTTELWDGTARESRSVIEHGSLIAGFTQDSRTLVLAPRDGDYRWHLLGPGSAHATVKVPTNPPLRLDLQFRPYDISGVEPIGALGRTDGTIELWNLATGKRVAAWRDGTNEITAARFSPDGTLLATGNEKGRVKLWIWNAHAGAEPPFFKVTPVPDEGGAVAVLVFSPNGQVLAGGWPNWDHVLLWDIVKDEYWKSLRGTGGGLTTIAFSPDGQRVAAGGPGSDVTVWDLPSGQRHPAFKGHQSSVIEVAYSPDGKTLATGGYHAIKLWNVATDQLVASLPMDRGVFRGLCFSPDGRTLALGYFGYPGHFVRQLHAPSIDEIAAAETSQTKAGPK